MNTKLMWTKEENLKLKELMELGKYSYGDISLIIKRTPQACRAQAKKLGLKSIYLAKKYNLNEDFWAIPDLLNSYWSGFSAADASIKKLSDNNYTYNLILSTKDISHLEKLKKDCEYTGPIKSRKRISSIMGADEKTYYNSSLSISCAKWGRDLEANFNVIPNKIYRLSPPLKLNNNLLMAWFLGYLDGDGAVFADKDGSRMMICIAGASEPMIKWIREFVNENFNEKITNKIDRYYLKPGSNCYHFNIAGIRAAIVADYLRQMPLPILKRKWFNPLVTEFIEKKKKEYPHLFKKLDIEEISKFLPSPNNISSQTPN